MNQALPMFALYFGIVVVTASIASGILFYFFPSHITHDVKGFATRQQLTPTPTTTLFSLTVISPHPATESGTTREPSITSNQTQQIAYQNSIIPTNTPSPLPSQIPSPSIRVVLTPTLFPLNNASISPSPTIRLSPTSPPPQTSYPPISFAPLSPTPNGLTQGLNADIIFNLVNQQRSTIELPPLEKDVRTCAIAQQRAPQVYNELFVTHTGDSGLQAMHVPYWITEVIINDDSEQDAVNWWLNDPVHRQIIDGNYSYSCVACSGYSCAQVFTNYVAK